MPRGRTLTKERLCITCPNCGYHWSPDPRKWNNWNLTLNHEKVLTCPCCGFRVKVSMSVLRDILRQRGML